MTKFQLVKGFYIKKLWSLDRVKDAVVAGWITEEQFKEITGQSYSPKAAAE